MLDAALKVIQLFNEHNYEAYLVGGYVRNTLLNKKVNDIDITTSATPDITLKLFSKAIPTGIDYGTITVIVDGYSFEVTTFRLESEYDDHRRPKVIQFATDLVSDLSRRDFTINAMAMDAQGQIYDYYHGKDDLENKIIRTVNDPYERISEDALRILRAIRFAVQYEFKIEEQLQRVIQEQANTILHLSYERKIYEINKILEADAIEYAKELLIDLNVYSYLQGFKKETMKLWSNQYSLETNWALLMLDEATLRIWKHSKKDIQKIMKVSKLIQQNGISNFDLYQYGLDLCSLANEVIHTCDAIDQLYCDLPIKSRKEIAIPAEEILLVKGIKAGPWMNTIFEILERKILNSELENEHDQLLDFVIKYEI